MNEQSNEHEIHTWINKNAFGRGNYAGMIIYIAIRAIAIVYECIY